MVNPLHTQPLDPRKLRTEPLRDFDDDDIVPWVIEMRVVGTPYILRAPMGRSFVVGRSDAAISFVPDIDLTDYGGQNRGVSRRHIQIDAKDNRLTIRDLGSANGTFLGGKRLEPQQDYRVQHGQTLTLGQLNIQVNFLVKPSVDERTRVDSAEKMGFPQLGRGERLLVVDENIDVGRVIGFMARQSGFAVTAVATVADAITEIDWSMPQGIITELMFEVGEGVDLIRYVREQASEQRVSIIAMTTANYTVGQALQYGADDFLLKPLTADTLLEALEKLAVQIQGSP